MNTYLQLRSGDWGIRATQPVKAGDTVTVSKKDGTSKSERIRRVIWQGNGVFLCAIDRDSRSRHTTSDDQCPCNHGRECRCGTDAPCCMCY